MPLLTQIEGHTLWAPALSGPSVVIDLGANKGNFSHGMLRTFECRSYAVEANPAVCDAIPPHPKLVVRNLAVAASSGRVRLHVSNNSEASTILETSGHDRDRRDPTVEVQAVSLPDLLTSLRVGSVDVMKFDIEGAEIAVLDSCSDDFLRGIGQLTIEFHDFCGLTPVETVERVVARLEALGFYRIKVWRHAWGDTLFVNRQLPSATVSSLAWARYVTRNWWGLKRVVQRRTQKT